MLENTNGRTVEYLRYLIRLAKLRVHDPPIYWWGVKRMADEEAGTAAHCTIDCMPLNIQYSRPLNITGHKHSTETVHDLPETARLCILSTKYLEFDKWC